MRRIVTMLLILALGLTLAACGKDEPATQEYPGSTRPVATKPGETETPVPTGMEIQASPDKYTWYIKNYVGKNAASFGYTSVGRDRLEGYGDGYVELILLTPGGEFVDIEDKEELKNWYVIAQCPAPNSELKYTFYVDEDGEEYDGVVEHQNIEEVVLAIAPVGSTPEPPQLTEIKPSPDRYTDYIRDYVGRNLMQCGYTSAGGDRLDRYQDALVQLNLVTEDGSYVDIENKKVLQNYVVTGQSIRPNTELKWTFYVDADGEEYDGIVETQTIEEIDLYVRQLDPNAVTEEEKPTEPEEETTEPTEEATEPTEENVQLVDGLRPEFKEAMDAYEAFYDEYCELMSKYMKNPADLTLMTQYMDLLDKSEEMDEAFEKWDDEDMNPAELKYYLEITDRVMDKLLKAMG